MEVISICKPEEATIPEKTESISDRRQVTDEPEALADVKLASDDRLKDSLEASRRSIPAEVENDAGADDIVTTSGISAPRLIPALRGKMLQENASVVCKGVWAMSQDALDLPGQTSNFEFKLIKAEEGSTKFPYNGKYQGWFHIKPAQNAKSPIKIEERQIYIKHSPVVAEENDDDKAGGKFVINGRGTNKFGNFTLRGQLEADGSVLMFREYEPKVPTIAGAKRKLDGKSKLPKASSNSAVSVATTAEAEALAGSVAPSMQHPATTPRETGRLRKISSAMKDYEDTGGVKVKSSTPRSIGNDTLKTEGEVSGKKVGVKIPSKEASAAGPVSVSGRSQRLSPALQKCNELLREIFKHPLSVWFHEPVDYVKLNIPDYPKIVKTPMDLKTIRTKLESFGYESHEMFAEHMRLVFRNAIMFNQMHDHPVHIAARELAKKFEDRFRVLSANLSAASLGYTYPGEAYVLEKTATRGTTPSNASGKGGKKGKVGGHFTFDDATTPRGGGGGARGRQSLGGGGGGPASKKARGFAAPGPRPIAAGAAAGYLPPAIDGNAHHLVEMQRRMEMMERELTALRTVVREKEIVQRLEETKEAAHNPLTFEEKKTLIGQIHKLPAHKMEEVLEIIQAAVPGGGADNDEIEIPLDALDTFTLRKLQTYIRDSNSEKKRKSVPGVAGVRRQSSGGGTGGKKSTSTTPRSAPIGLSAPAPAFPLAPMGYGDAQGGHGEDTEELLFGFDELGAPPAAGHRETQAPTSDSYPQTAAAAAAEPQQLHQPVKHQQQRAVDGGHNENDGDEDDDFDDLLNINRAQAAQGVAPLGQALLAPSTDAMLADFRLENADAWASTASETQRLQGAGVGEDRATVGSGGSWSGAAQQLRAQQEAEEARKAESQRLLHQRLEAESAGRSTH